MNNHPKKREKFQNIIKIFMNTRKCETCVKLEHRQTNKKNMEKRIDCENVARKAPQSSLAWNVCLFNKRLNEASSRQHRHRVHLRTQNQQHHNFAGLFHKRLSRSLFLVIVRLVHLSIPFQSSRRHFHFSLVSLLRRPFMMLTPVLGSRMTPTPIMLYDPFSFRFFSQDKSTTKNLDKTLNSPTNHHHYKQNLEQIRLQLEKEILDWRRLHEMEGMTPLEPCAKPSEPLHHPFATSRESSDGIRHHRHYMQRIFVNRCLHLENIKFFGFDMDYTIATYKSPHFESVSFEMVKERLIEVGYPKEIGAFFYDPTFPVRGLWFDNETGNLLKVDSYGNILVAVNGFKFLNTHEIYSTYPNKFIQMDESRIYVLNTLFNQPETYMLACVIDFFNNSPDYSRCCRTGTTPNGIKAVDGSLFMSYKSIQQDIRTAFDWLHGQNILKKKTVDEIDKFIERDERLPILFQRMHDAGKKSFLLTNSDYNYTEKVMTYLFDIPSANGKNWKSFFDYIVVDARKPLFFGEGTTLRQVNTETGALKIGTHTGPFEPGQVYSGGSCDIFTEMIGAMGKDVLYVGDHIYGDILKSKKIRGWRTFLVVPELMHELDIYMEKHWLVKRLTELDAELGALYVNMDSTSQNNPNTSALRQAIRETSHRHDMSYGMLGSIFRCGSRQTHFANQVSRYADLYSSSFVNLIYYPFSYFFRAPKMLMPHESTAEAEMARLSNGNDKQANNVIDVRKESIDSTNRVTMTDRSKSLKQMADRNNLQHQVSVPHLFAEEPKVVTHHHDTDDDDADSGVTLTKKKASKKVENFEGTQPPSPTNEPVANEVLPCEKPKAIVAGAIADKIVQQKHQNDSKSAKQREKSIKKTSLDKQGPRLTYAENIFANRSLHLEKIKYFGFDMDYTIAIYKNPEFESISFEYVKQKLIDNGYPKEIGAYYYDPAFPIRGLWFDTENGHLLKVDSFGNILVAVSGFKFLTTSEIYALYPNKFVQLDESRIFILNTLFNQPETYMLACVIDFFNNSPVYKKACRTGQTPNGIRTVDGSVFMSYKSIQHDIRNAFDWLHSLNVIKKKTLDELDRFVEKDARIPVLFERMRSGGKKTFLLTNSDFNYTERIMTFLFDTPASKGKNWKSFFDYIVVDAKKPAFFGEGTPLRQVDLKTKTLKIGFHTGPMETGKVYSGGSCETLTDVLGAVGKEVLYIGDHIYGDILKCKKIRGWRTFLVIPELRNELETYTENYHLIKNLISRDSELGALYKNIDSSSVVKPNTTDLRNKIRDTCHQIDMCYGLMGSIFRSGSRQTHFANQVTRYADLYSSTYLNLLYYSFSYFFRSPRVLMAHEIVAESEIQKSYNSKKNNTNNMRQFQSIIHQEHRIKSLAALDKDFKVCFKSADTQQLYAEIPKSVTHHHDTDDDDS